MAKALITRFALLAAVVLGLAGCTVHQAETPELSGPSEFALSFGVAATPDAISLDGGSQSSIVVSAFDSNGAPKGGVTFRLDMFVGDVAADYGTLSGKTIVTGTDGRASSIYTAPPPLPEGTNLPTCRPNVFSESLPGPCIDIVASPIGSNYVAGLTQSVKIHLIPQGVILPPAATPTASFVFAPSTPAANVPVQFDASASCSGPTDGGACSGRYGPIISYEWDFGDGGKATGKLASHTYGLARTYSVTLTVMNDRGVKASTTKQLSLGAGSEPLADFVFSPTAPVKNQEVTFDASLSRPGLGHAIVGYKWNWGDGDTAGQSSSPLQDHDYAAEGSYTVVLTVIDESGQTGTATKTITVGTGTVPGSPNAVFVNSPTAPLVGQQVNFDASGSTAATGHTIAQYKWNFGDGTALVTSANPLATHTYTTVGSYTVTLSVTDELGQTTTKSQVVVVAASAPGQPPTASFVSSPSSPVVGQTINFNANQSAAAAGKTISQYRWTWGDGSPTTTGASPLATHAYSSAGTYTVSLTVTDNTGLTNTATQTITVGVNPTANFTSSPSAPGVSQTVFFDATSSTAAPGFTIASYAWNFGDGSTSASGPTTSHPYSAAGTYTVTLTVTDNAGQKGTKSNSVTVGGAPTARFVVSTIPGAPLMANFNASQSTASPGHTIVHYGWNFGDNTTGTGVTPAPHAYPAPGTYVVVLTVTDDVGQTGTTTATVTVTLVSTPPTANFVASTSGLNVTVNGNLSTAAAGRTITTYAWDFGDSTTGSGPLPPVKTYSAPGTYSIVLTVTDDIGQTNSTSKSVTVTP